MRSWIRYAFVSIALVTVVLLGGCGGGGGGTTGKDPTVYFINASADAGLLDFVLNGIARGASMDYLDSSADFITIPFVSDANGAYDLILRETGPGDELDAENRVFGQNTHSVVVALGLKNFVVGEELKRIRPSTLLVNRTAPTGNKARLYVVHAFVREAGQATPQIKFQNAGNNPQFSTGAIDFGGSATITVDSGTMDWWAKRDDASGDVVYASATVTLDPSSVYIVLVAGIENDADVNKQPRLEFIKLPTI